MSVLFKDSHESSRPQRTAKLNKMNLQSYLTQKPVEKLSPFSVKLKENEIIRHKTIKVYNHTLTSITIKEFKKFNYVLISGTGAVYTMDKKGHPDKSTVFQI